MKKTHLIALIAALFLFRVAFGLCSEFWFPDELQTYLIGLKWYTTHAWPYYGPDVVYTNSQIPGALQGLLVGLPFYIANIPESPTIFLNILSFCSLSLLAFFISKRFTDIPQWVTWLWVMTAPWTMNYSTRVVNPSYVLVFSIPFFIAFLGLFEPSIRWMGKKVSYFIMGLTTTLIMQLHLSWVLLIPFAGLIFLIALKNDRMSVIAGMGFYLSGLAIGALTLIPTFLQHEVQSKAISSNIVFNAGNFGNIITILTRYLALASFEIPYMLGGDTAERLAVITEVPWMAPFTVYVLLFGFLQVGLFIYAFFIKQPDSTWLNIKRVMLGSYLVLFASFFFSVKGPSSHTFYLLLPLVLFYTFYCYRWVFERKQIALKLFKIALICGIFFHAGLAVYSFRHKSLYKDREKAVQAINEKDYKILGNRRADEWGYGY